MWKRSFWLVSFAAVAAMARADNGESTVLADADQRQDAEATLVVHGSRAVASGYEARGTDIERVDLNDLARLPAATADLLFGLSGVAENGQGGWVQMYSVRGVSRQRVMTYVAGIPIITDRRAGTAAHFVDPALLGEATVMAGPASSIYGLGALGGIVQFFPRDADGPLFGMQVDDNGNGRGLYAGWGDDDTTVMVAGLQRDDSEAADGTRINDHGERWSALLRQQWQWAGGELAFVALPAQLRDVGRANANFYNNRITTTPDEDHLPMRLSFRAASGWEAAWFVHDSQVVNVTERVGVSVTEVDNRATDTGVNFQWPWQHAALRGRLGIDWLARLDVTADENIYRIATDSYEQHDALAAGEEQQLSMFSELETAWLGGELQWGLRLTAQQQSARGEPDNDDSAYATHLGWERLFDERWLVFASVGSAVRFPALTERYYTGTTPRGSLLGNAELEPETAQSFELGVRTRIADAVLTAQVFQQRVEDYIEQVVVQPSPQVNSYINLDRATLEGVELDLRWPVTDSLTLSVAAHHLRGDAEYGEALAGTAAEVPADIPADRWRLGIEQEWQDCGVGLNWTWRRAKSDVGLDEIPLAAADYGEADLRCQLGAHWRAALVVSNASDELYLANADSQAALMPGRRISLRLSWQ